MPPAMQPVRMADAVEGFLGAGDDDEGDMASAGVSNEWQWGEKSESE